MAIKVVRNMVNIFTAELLWLEQVPEHENWFQLKVVPARQGKFYIYKPLSRDSFLYKASAGCCEFSGCYFHFLFLVTGVTKNRK